MAGEVLQGHKKPYECPVFGTRCTPDNPLGAPMVSAEGACAAYYRYRRRQSLSRDVHTMTAKPDPFQMSCPAPRTDHDTVQLAHGGGGRMMRTLIEGLLLPCFRGAHGSAESPPPHDSAVVEIGGVRLAFTTDSFVVSPLFFPGGDIGKLAVYGTVNDLAMAGAKPLYLSCGLILEEGTPLDIVRRVVQSMQQAAEEVGVQIVTGDTKVVDRGKADGIFINTAGVGLVPAGIEVHPSQVSGRRQDPDQRRHRPTRHRHHVAAGRFAVSKARRKATAHRWPISWAT